MNDESSMNDEKLEDLALDLISGDIELTERMHVWLEGYMQGRLSIDKQPWWKDPATLTSISVILNGIAILLLAFAVIRLS